MRQSSEIHRFTHIVYEIPNKFSIISIEIIIFRLMQKILYFFLTTTAKMKNKFKKETKLGEKVSNDP